MRCSPRTSPAPHRSPSRTRAARPRRRSQAATGELQPVLLGEGTGKSASVDDLRNRRTYDATNEDLAELRKAIAEHLPRVRSRRLKRSAQRPPRPPPHAPPRDPHRRDHAPRPPRPPAPPAAAAAPDRRVRLAARAHARLPALRLGRAGRDVHVRHPPHPHHQGAAPPRRRRRAGARQRRTSTTPTAAPASAPRCRSSSTRRATPTAPAARSRSCSPTASSAATRRRWCTPCAASRGSRTGCCGGRRSALDPTYRPITRAMAAIRTDVELAGARDLPTLLEQVRRL